MHKSYMCPHRLNIEGAEEERTTNAYTPGWFDTFLRAYWPEQTAREVDFLSRQLPLPAYRDVLDVCCGAGRHALPLAARGHRVTGLDRDERMLSQARRGAAAAAANGGGATFVSGDMRELAAAVSGAFDAAICMWQSFGYFDAATNADVLRQMREALRPGGRLILDLYNRDAFSEGSGAETTERAGRAITTTQTLAGDRLAVAIDYGTICRAIRSSGRSSRPPRSPCWRRRSACVRCSPAPGPTSGSCPRGERGGWRWPSSAARNGCCHLPN
jgi:SAM-dependent methyltransferase